MLWTLGETRKSKDFAAHLTKVKNALAKMQRL